MENKIFYYIFGCFTLFAGIILWIGHITGYASIIDPGMFYVLMMWVGILCLDMGSMK